MSEKETQNDSSPDISERRAAEPATVRRTANHIYEHCSSVVVIGMEVNGDVRGVIQLGRDMTELANGSTKGDNKVETVRHTFATISLDRDAAIQLAEGLSRTLGFSLTASEE